MNRRLVDTRPDVKKFMNRYRKLVNEKRPTKRQPIKREQYFKDRAETQRQKGLFWNRVYKDLLEESFTYPIPLRLDHDFDHKSDWRYCIYQGMVYQFDKPDLPDAEMIRQINLFENQDSPAASESGRIGTS